MKNTYFKLITLGLTATLSLLAHAPVVRAAEGTEGKIATVDFEYLFRNFWESKRAEAQINSRIADVESNRQEKLQAMRKLESDLAKLEQQIREPALSVEKKEELRKESEAKQAQHRKLYTELADYLSAMQKDIGDMHERLRRDVVEKIRKAIDQKARQQAFAFVFDISGRTHTNVPVILYTNNRYDITQEVLAELNRTAPPVPQPVPAGGGTSTPAPAPTPPAPPTTLTPAPSAPAEKQPEKP